MTSYSNQSPSHYAQGSGNYQSTPKSQHKTPTKNQPVTHYGILTNPTLASSLNATAESEDIINKNSGVYSPNNQAMSPRPLTAAPNPPSPNIFTHSRSQSHNNTPSPPLFQPVHHDQISTTNLYQSNFNFQTNPTNQLANWTSLIPPMPSKPQSSYKTESHKEVSYLNNSPNASTYVFQQQRLPYGQNHSNQAPPNPNQRHSIAISSTDNLSRNVDPNNSPSHPYQTFNKTLQAPPAPTQEIPPNVITNQSRKKSVRRKGKKTCKKCGLEITGQFVRALNSAFHVECFCCHECGKQCSAKFFPFELNDAETNVKSQVALCEYHYFKKLDLICYNCNNALSGPYITALGNKYHLEHFKCAVCQKVFESDESYYEHENNILCHYHYSKLYASHCEGCHSSIVKQFVELFRGGRNQQWHPECYMVHKFWNVCVMADSVGLQKKFGVEESTLLKLRNLRNEEESSLDPNLLLSIEQQIENIVMQCWLTLSGYEETTAGCISDMLLNACTGNQEKGLLATGKLILNIEVLFNALDYILKLCKSSVPILKEQYQPQITSDDLDTSITLENEYFQPLKKEPRNISGKIMSYLAILRKSNQISKSGSLSAELLSVITGCAHYLKLLIRMGLNNALKLNKLLGFTDATDNFLKMTALFEMYNIADDKSSDIALIKGKLSVSSQATDACVSCTKSIEKSCLRFQENRWHVKCFTCSECYREIPTQEAESTKFNTENSSVICKDCNGYDFPKGFEVITDLSQLIYLLKIALSRSQSVMNVQIGKNLDLAQEPDNNLSKIDEDNRSATEDNYSQTLNDVTRLRTRRQSQKLSNSIKQNARKSVILEAPEADKAKKDEVANNIDETVLEELSDISFDNKATPVNKTDRKASTASHFSFTSLQQGNDSLNVKKALKIRDEPQRKLTNAQLDRTSDLLKNEKSLTLDDIPRIVAAEQARDQRPNAFKHHNSLYQRQKPIHPVKSVSNNLGSNNSPSLISPTNALDNILNAPSTVTAKRPKYYSELSKDEHFIMRHIAVEALLNFSGNKYNKEDLLSLIQTKKQPTFWDKFKFGGDGSKKDKNMLVFGVDLLDLTRKYGIDSDLGVGPSRLRIPIVIDDVINALRQKDMSVEGIFRLNGNIKRLRELTEEINKSPLKSPDFSHQTAVQLAALMKKWLRELPNPLLTFNLYELWIASQREDNSVKRKRVLQLAYCMLPRSHRNLLEVLLYFFSWVASFAEIDEETGSKMDIHNLATVIAPNILFAKSNGNDATPQSGDTYFLAIEVVNLLIELHEEMSVIPDDLLQFFDKCGFNNLKPDISTKEIMTILDRVLKEEPNFFNLESLATPEGISNQMVHTNTILRNQSKVLVESRGESSKIE